MWGIGTGHPGKLWMPLPEIVQGQTGQGFEQPSLVEGSPPCSRGFQLGDLEGPFQHEISGWSYDLLFTGKEMSGYWKVNPNCFM